MAAHFKSGAIRWLEVDFQRAKDLWRWLLWSALHRSSQWWHLGLYFYDIIRARRQPKSIHRCHLFLGSGANLVYPHRHRAGIFRNRSILGYAVDYQVWPDICFLYVQWRHYSKAAQWAKDSIGHPWLVLLSLFRWSGTDLVCKAPATHADHPLWS